jgi:hypothetical protein
MIDIDNQKKIKSCNLNLHKKANSEINFTQNNSKMIMYYRKAYLPGLLIMERFSDTKLFQYKKIFLDNLFHLINMFEMYNLNTTMQNFSEILSFEGLKLLLNLIKDIFNQNKLKQYYTFFRKYSTFEKFLTIKKKKTFIYFHKLLVFRNVLLDQSQFYQNALLIKRLYFYRLKRIKNEPLSRGYEVKKNLRILIESKNSEKNILKRKFIFSFLTILYKKNIQLEGLYEKNKKGVIRLFILLLETEYFYNSIK